MSNTATIGSIQFSSRNGYALTLNPGLGDAARVLNDALQATVRHYYAPVSRTSVQKKFKTLTLTWKIDTRNESNPSIIAQHPAYRQIIGMGQEALPYIFTEMQHRPAHWFVALQSITGVNPIKPEHRGNIEAMTEDWLKWNERQNRDN